MGRKVKQVIIYGGVYAIICTATWRSYIGSSCDIDLRMKCHFESLRNNRHQNPDLQKDWNQYGKDKFKWEVIEKIEDDLVLLDREEYWFNLGCNLYNKNNMNTAIKISLHRQKLFWEKVIITDNIDDCWEWTRFKDKDGYGRLSVSENGQKRMYRSNRLAYYLAYPDTSKNLMICHSCDNPACCNPNHLVAQSSKYNSQDTVKKGRRNIIQWEMVYEMREFFKLNPNIYPKDLEEWFFNKFNLKVDNKNLVAICINRRWRDKNYFPPERTLHLNSGVNFNNECLD